MVCRTLLLRLAKQSGSKRSSSGQPRGTGQRWIDSLRVYCVAGSGGHGQPAFGGVGGRGGDVILEATPGYENSSLLKVFKDAFGGDSRNQKLKAARGEDSRKARLVGAAGADRVLRVPAGISVLLDQEDVQIPVAELLVPGDRTVLARGGAGGCSGNSWIGAPGQKRFVRLSLKLIADLGLVGFPNAGKSTFLKAVSRASPKIASYPFTTIKPNLGHIRFDDNGAAGGPDLAVGPSYDDDDGHGHGDDGREISVADLPGLIEGAHANRGMGHRFLKHVERTRCILLVVDVQGYPRSSGGGTGGGDQPGEDRWSAFETLVLLNRELELYNPDLVRKPAVCLVNKMDVDGAQGLLDDFCKSLAGFSSVDLAESGFVDPRQPETLCISPGRKLRVREVIPMSAKHSRKSVQHVKQRLRSVLDDIQDERDGHNAKVKELEQRLATLNSLDVD